MTTLRYGDWHIQYNPPPIPVRNCDWQFWHDDYDGAPDAFDNRHGSAASPEDAKMEIDMIEDMDREFTEDENKSVHQALVKVREMMLLQHAPLIIRGLLSIPNTGGCGILTGVHINAARKWLDDFEARELPLDRSEVA